MRKIEWNPKRMSEEVKKMFSEISLKYDLMNDLLSFGIHRLWRRVLARLASRSVPKPQEILDCAGGTGDVAFTLEKKFPSANITCTDFCEDMLEIAKVKAARHGSRVRFRAADAMHLPFDPDSFDLVTISFGIRNVDDPALCLADMARVTKPGGRVLVLEFGAPKGFFGVLYRFYSKWIMPTIGKLIAGSRRAYTYLPETAAKFPAGDEFIRIMNQCGCFSESASKKLSFGIAYIYIGTVR